MCRPVLTHRVGLARLLHNWVRAKSTKEVKDVPKTKVPYERKFPGKWMQFYSPAELSIQERLVWRTINEYQWANETAWPSYKTLGKACGIGERQVQRIVKSLEAKGLLWITHNKKHGRSNNYRCLVPEYLSEGLQESHEQISGAAGADTSGESFVPTDDPRGAYLPIDDPDL